MFITGQAVTWSSNMDHVIESASLTECKEALLRRKQRWRQWRKGWGCSHPWRHIIHLVKDIKRKSNNTQNCINALFAMSLSLLFLKHVAGVWLLLVRNNFESQRQRQSGKLLRHTTDHRISLKDLASCALTSGSRDPCNSMGVGRDLKLKWRHPYKPHTETCAPFYVKCAIKISFTTTQCETDSCHII